MKPVFGQGFKGEVIGRDGKYMIIKCDYSMKGVRIGDPCLVNPYKFENSQERRNWMPDDKVKKRKRG